MSVAPQLLAKTDSTGPTAAPKGAVSPTRTFELRHDSRAVARRDSR